ncbi:hypothetical protein [Shewanella marina]|uniref:hypothetical protein n=1 Tax=Shewanella marina TaxID=487319 RepID=UPI0005696881|nr:hypothetical protein [Shewanella marina]
MPKFLVLLPILAILGLSGCAQLKDAGRTIGHTTKDITTSIGHSTRDAAKEIKSDLSKEN